MRRHRQAPAVPRRHSRHSQHREQPSCCPLLCRSPNRLQVARLPGSSTMMRAPRPRRTRPLSRRPLASARDCPGRQSMRRRQPGHAGTAGQFRAPPAMPGSAAALTQARAGINAIQSAGASVGTSCWHASASFVGLSQNWPYTGGNQVCGWACVGRVGEWVDCRIGQRSESGVCRLVVPPAIISQVDFPGAFHA